MARWSAERWRAFGDAVAAWDAEPLAFAAMRRAQILPHVPADLALRWRRAHAGATATSMHLAHEASEIVRALARVGVPSAPLKGVALFLLGAHRDPGSRSTCDIDLVVRPEDRVAVTRVLLGRGYVATRAGGPKHWPPFVRDRLVVEVHPHAFWSLADGHRVGVEEVVDGAGRPKLGVVAAHLLHHLFESSVTTPWLVVKTLADLSEIQAFCEHFPGRGAEVEATCAAFGVRDRLATLAGWLDRITGSSQPLGWARGSRADRIDWLADRTLPVSGGVLAALRLPDRLAAFGRMPLREKAHLLRHHAAPDPEALGALYGLPAHSPWVWPLYAVRPFHLLGQSLADAAQLASRRIQRRP